MRRTLVLPVTARPFAARREWLAHRGGLLAFALAITFALESITSYPIGYDLAAYLLAARRLIAGAGLYEVADHGAVALGPFGQFFYPPLVAAAFAPLALLPPALSFTGWFLFLAVVAAAVAWSVVRTLPYALQPWAAAAFAFFFPLGWEVRLGNLTLLSLALCLLAWKHRARPALSGAILAGAIGLKLLPLAIIVFYLAAGRGRTVLWSVAFAAAAVAVSWPWLGAAWVDFAALLLTLARGDPATGSNIVPAIFAEPPARLALPALAIVSALAAGRLARTVPALETYALYLALATAPLVSATVFYPYLVFALPLLVGAGPYLNRWAGRLLLAAARRPVLRLLEASGRPFAWLLMQAQLLREPGRDFTLPLLGLLLLVVIGLAAFVRPRSGE